MIGEGRNWRKVSAVKVMGVLVVLSLYFAVAYFFFFFSKTKFSIGG